MSNKEEELIAALDDAIAKITAFMDTLKEVQAEIEDQRVQPPKWTTGTWVNLTRRGSN